MRSTARRYLNEIVRADAEEVRFLCEQIGGERRRRHFDHDADRNVGNRQAARAQRFRGPRHGAARRSQLVEAGNERKHDAQRAVRGGAQQGAQLRLEDLVERQAEADAAQSERRAGPFNAGVFDRQLRFADVERADGHAPPGRTLEEPPVGDELRLLGERALSAAGEQELGPEKPDAFGAALPCPAGVVRCFDVGFEPDRDAVNS